MVKVGGLAWIATRDGFKQVAVRYICGEWAVTVKYEGGGYAVTHLPTGAQGYIGRFAKCQAAVKALGDAVDPFDLRDWSTAAAKRLSKLAGVAIDKAPR